MAYWLDDGFDTWPEVAQAGAAAVGLYVRCGAWIARNIANGRITDAVIPGDVAGMYGTVEWRQRLVDVGLWAVEGSGYRDQRYFDLNPTASKLAELKKKRRAAGQLGGIASGVSRSNRSSKREASAQASASRVVEPPALPSSKEGRAGKKTAAAARGSPHAYEADGYECKHCPLPETHPVHRGNRR